MLSIRCDIPAVASNCRKHRRARPTHRLITSERPEALKTTRDGSSRHPLNWSTLVTITTGDFG
jgi:hypothetical protein